MDWNVWFNSINIIKFKQHRIYIHSFHWHVQNSLPFSGASTIPLYYVLFLATLLCQLFFHPLSLHLSIYFLVYLSILLFPNSYIILFWEPYFLPFSVHAQTNVVYLTLLSLYRIYIKFIFQNLQCH